MNIKKKKTKLKFIRKKSLANRLNKAKDAWKDWTTNADKTN